MVTIFLTTVNIPYNSAPVVFRGNAYLVRLVSRNNQNFKFS